ncbi:MAG: lactonase family protein [Anaerolineales bacterium]
MTTSLVLVGSYAKADQPGLHAFWFDAATGALAPHGVFAGIFNPAFFVIHPNQRWLYTVSETGMGSDGASGAVWALRFEHEPWAAQPLNQQPSRGDWPCHLTLDAAGRWLLVSNYGTGTVGVFPILPDGALGAMTDLVQHTGDGPRADRQEGPHAHSANFTPDQQHVIVADLGIDALVVYTLSAEGQLREHSRASTRPGAGPRHLTFHPNGHMLYVANELDCTVTAFEYDSARGLLSERDTLATLPSGAPETTVADIHLSASGRRLYVSNRGHNSLAVYDVDEAGQLTSLGYPACGGNWPRNFAIAPNDNFVLVANQYSGEVCVLPVTADGVGEPVTRVAVPGASCIQFV